MTATGRVGASSQILVNNGPQLRFGANSVNAVVTLSNPSVNGLDITAITLANNGSGAFTLVSADPTSLNSSTGRTRGQLNSGDSMTFIIQYLSPGNGTSSTADLVITSNDADAPTMTVPLEAGTSLSDPVTETVNLGHLSNYIGYMLRDSSSNVYAVNTDTDTAALVLEGSPDFYRVYFAVDTSTLPSGITAVNSVELQLNSSGHNGINLLQGQQGELLDTANFEPATGTVLNQALIPAGNLSAALNQDANDLFLSIIQNNSQTVVPMMFMAVDAIPGTIDLTTLNVVINYTR